ncbi:MAG: hypothetical protein JW940_39405 [Polyangiaceae bacterium]|nr:hypothetical protein [Polyangiaceae bacterium]
MGTIRLVRFMRERGALSVGRWCVAGTVVCGSVYAAAACSTGPIEQQETEAVGTAEQALCQNCAYGKCTSESHDTCNMGIWPGGVIYWDWDPEQQDVPAYKNVATQAMADWQNLTGGVVRFQQAPSSMSHPVALIWSGPGKTLPNDGLSGGYSNCSTTQRGGCQAHFEATLSADGKTASSNGVYHELGHLIGLFHHFQRTDRNKYVEICSNVLMACNNPVNVCQNGNWAACDGTALSAFGPFDFRSTMHYAAAHPSITRWDGTLFIPEETDCSCPVNAVLPLPEQCLNDDCTGSNCTTPADASGPAVCPTCPGCQKRQLYGFPTKGDAAGVVDLYSTPVSWQLFTRTVPDDGIDQPFNYNLAPGVQIKADTNPALDAWDNGKLTMYALGTDQRMYYKRKSATGSWGSSWSIVPSSVSTLSSSPGASAWGTGRSDIVAKGTDNAVWINSYVSGGWTGWMPLGTPSGGALSAPSIIRSGSDRIDVFVQNGSRKLYVKSCTSGCTGGNRGSWTSWQKRFGDATFRGVPAPVSRGAGLVDIFVHGDDHRIWGNSYHYGAPGSWYQVRPDLIGYNSSCPDCYSPAVTSRGSNMIDLVVRGTDDQLWMANWVYEWGAWNNYYRLGGVLKSSPAMASRVRSANRVDVVATMEEEQEAYTFHRGVWWKTWPSN